MKQNKFDVRLVNGIVTIFAIIFIVILLIVRLCHFQSNAFSNVIVRNLYFGFPIVLSILDIICWVKQRKKKRDDAGSKRLPKDKTTKKIRERTKQLVNDLLLLKKNSILIFKKYYLLLKYGFLIEWAISSRMIINERKFNMYYILLLICAIIVVIYFFLFTVETFKLVRMNFKALILITLVSIIFGSIESTQIRWGISIIGNMILYTMNYDFFRVVYKKYENYMRLSPKKNTKNVVTHCDLDATKSNAKIRLNNWKAMIGLVTCIINALIAITETPYISGLVSNIAKWSLNGLSNNDNSLVVVFLTNVMTIFWNGMAKFVVILIILAMGIILVRKLEECNRNKIEKFFLYIFAVQEEN